MLWKALTECNSSGMLILSGRIMRVTRRWKIEKFHGHLSAASTEADGQWGEPAWPLKREGKESKVNSPIGNFFFQENLVNTELERHFWQYVCFCLKSLDGSFYWEESGMRNSHWQLYSAYVCKNSMKVKKNIKWLINLEGAPPWCLNTYSLQEPPCTYLLISFYTFNFCAGLYVT